jgi:hypothetical protein
MTKKVYEFGPGIDRDLIRFFSNSLSDWKKKFFFQIFKYFFFTNLLNYVLAKFYLFVPIAFGANLIFY